MFYLTTHSTRFIYSYMALVTDKINDNMILIYLYIKREREVDWYILFHFVLKSLVIMKLLHCRCF